MHAVMSAVAFANANHVGFVHTPFRKIAHRRGNKLRWLKRWEDFFSLSYAGHDSLIERSLSLDTFLEAPFAAPRPLVLEGRDYHELTDRNPDAYLPIIDRLRACYERSDKSRIPIHRKPGELTVAVHIRRGDILDDKERMLTRYTSDDRLLRTIDVVRALGRRNRVSVRVNVYSEGWPWQFRVFRNEGCDLYLDKDPFETLHNLISADILVIAKSSFSYVAALLSNGCKLYEPFWHRPLSQWTVLNEDGGFSDESLAPYLGRL